MSDDPTIDRSTLAWLESGPGRAPARVVEATLRAIDTTPQEPRLYRFPWRFQPMMPALRVAAAILLVAAVGGGAIYLARPTDSNRGTGATAPPAIASTLPGPVPSPSTARATSTPAATQAGDRDDLGALAERATDAAAGISVAYPTGWSPLVHPDGVHSIGVEQPGPVTSTSPAVRFTAGWVGLAPGQSPEDWLAEQDAPVENGLDCPAAPDPAVAIAGHAGAIIDGGCLILGSRAHYRAVVVIDGRGYTFHMDTTHGGEANFRALLAGIVIDPPAGS